MFSRSVSLPHVAYVEAFAPCAFPHHSTDNDQGNGRPLSSRVGAGL